jgi:hypothetical protein
MYILRKREFSFLCIIFLLASVSPLSLSQVSLTQPTSTPHPSSIPTSRKDIVLLSAFFRLLFIFLLSVRLMFLVCDIDLYIRYLSIRKHAYFLTFIS